MTGQDQKPYSVMADKHVLYGTCPVNRVLCLSGYIVAVGPPTVERGGTGHLPVYYGNRVMGICNCRYIKKVF